MATKKAAAIVDKLEPLVRPLTLVALGAALAAGDAAMIATSAVLLALTFPAVQRALGGRL